METLKNLNKLWRTSALLSSTTTAAAADRVYSNKEVLLDEEEDEGESFFELELIMLNSKTRDKENEGLRSTAKEVNVGRRVEPHVKPHGPHPHSPVSTIMKSAPKFKVSLFRKHRNNSYWPDLKPKLKQGPRVDDEEKDNVTISTLVKESSSNSPISKQSLSKCKTDEDDDDAVSVDSSSSSKRFSKDVMHKYLKLKLIKPFHLKVAKRCASVNNNNKSSRRFEAKDCSSSPAPSTSTSSSSSSGYGYGLRVVCRHLGKSRSASSMMVVGSRRDESLMVEHDDGGIQSAILHCKRSFNSSRDRAVIPMAEPISS